MILDSNSTTPIYIQIAEWLETEILKGNFKVDEKIYSQYQLAEMLQINPATAAKGLTLLSEENILYDRRGLGKFITKDAKDIIVYKRKNEVLKTLVDDLVQEAQYLRMSKTELEEMIREAYRQLGGDKEWE